MALKYYIEFVDRLENLYRVEIDSPAYEGEPIQLTPAENPLYINWNGNDDDNPFKMHVINSNIEITVVSELLDVDELMLINDASYKCRVYYQSALHWQGYVISDGIKAIDSGVPYDITIRAIDGLELLPNTDFVGHSGWEDIIVDGVTSSRRAPIHAIRTVLFNERHLDNTLPIRWSCSLKNLRYPISDAIGGQTDFDKDGKLSLLRNKTAFWWLDNLVKSLGCWVFQQDGYWYILSYTDLLSNDGILDFWEISTEIYTPVTATSVSIDLNIQGSDFVNENQTFFSKKPLSGVNVTYQNTTDSGNVIPNGTFDNWSFGALVDWGFEDIAGDSPLLEQYESLNKRTGYAVRVANDGTATQSAVFSFFGTMPLDTKVLYKQMTWGFTFMPQFGFAYYTDTGIINFEQTPLKVSVTFTWKGETWYLNEYGYWWNENTATTQQKVEIAENRPGAPGFYLLFTRDVAFQPGDVIYVSVLRSGVVENHTIVFDTLMTTQQGIDLMMGQIGNCTQIIGIPDKMGFRIENVTYPSVANTVKLGKTKDAVENINVINVDGVKINDIVQIQFTGKGGNSEILFPEIDNYNGIDGRLDIKFTIPPGQAFVLDELYMNVANDNDIYSIVLDSSKNSKEDYTLEISSGFSGNLLSSYKDRYYNANESMLWTGGKTLTQIYGETIMNWRNKPCRIFDGDIDDKVGWGLYDILGLKYVPLSIRQNCRDVISTVTATEIRQDVLSYSVTHKSSGDNEGA